MLANTINELRNFIHAQFCYQLFITPIHMPLTKEYRDFANLACEYLNGKQTKVIHHKEPRHFVIHHFAQPDNPNAKKVLLTHGWMSRAAYLIRWIMALHKAGYEIYAPDFPAHGESEGLQLPWTDAVEVIRRTMNQYGPFHAVIGHSFGGAMWLNTLNLAGQLPEFTLNDPPPKSILVASPTRMRTPMRELARKFWLDSYGFQYFKRLVKYSGSVDLIHLRLQNFIRQELELSFLCIHGDKDGTVNIKESLVFCDRYPHAELCILPDANHVSVLMDNRVEEKIVQFLA